MTEHVLRTCDCGRDVCPICSWGAAICANCGGAEVDLQQPCVPVAPAPTASATTDSTSKAVPPQGLTRFDVTFADKIARHPEGNFMFYADHAAELERLSKERDEWKNRFGVGVVAAFATVQARAEAAESKLSQLQLSNEEKAKKIAEWQKKLETAFYRLGILHMRGCEIDQTDVCTCGAEADRTAFKNLMTRFLAILNGGQQ